MAFVLPTFNLPVSIWRNGNATTNPADVQTTGNLTPGRRALTPSFDHPAGTVLPANMHLLLPPGIDIRDAKAASGFDTVEVPTGSGRFYEVDFVDDIGGGFANEHRFAQLRGLGPWPVPFPSAGGGLPIGGGADCSLAVAISLGVLYSTVIPPNPTPGTWFQLANSVPPGATPFTIQIMDFTAGTNWQLAQGPCALLASLAEGVPGQLADGVYSATALPATIHRFFFIANDDGIGVPWPVRFRITQP